MDCLSDAERVKDKETEKLESLLEGDIDVSRHMVNSEAEFFAQISQLEQLVKDELTILHISAHGVTNSRDPFYRSPGIAISNDGSQIEWQSLREPLTSLNQKTGGNLVLNLMACRGSNAFKIGSIQKVDAFRVVIGPHKDVLVRRIIPITECFYGHLSRAQWEFLATKTAMIAIDTLEGECYFNAVSATTLARWWNAKAIQVRIDRA